MVNIAAATVSTKLSRLSAINSFASAIFLSINGDYAREPAPDPGSDPGASLLPAILSTGALSFWMPLRPCCRSSWSPLP